MQIYAHRGASAERPENTLAAFARALELGVTGIELDIHLSADGVPVVIHDDTLDRTTNGTGPVGAATAADLASLDAGDGERVPTLAEVLDLAGSALRVNIEIKDPSVVPAMIEVTSARPHVSWFASSGSWPSLDEVVRLSPGADVYPLSIGRPENVDALVALAGPDGPEVEAALRARVGQGTLDAAIRFATASGGSGVSVWEHDLSGEHVDAIHDGGLHAWVWTVNDAARAGELMGLGIDAICTDDPALMLRVVAEGHARTA